MAHRAGRADDPCGCGPGRRERWPAGRRRIGRLAAAHAGADGPDGQREHGDALFRLRAFFSRRLAALFLQLRRVQQAFFLALLFEPDAELRAGAHLHRRWVLGRRISSWFRRRRRGRTFQQAGRDIQSAGCPAHRSKPHGRIPAPAPGAAAQQSADGSPPGNRRGSIRRDRQSLEQQIEFECRSCRFRRRTHAQPVERQSAADPAHIARRTFELRLADQMSGPFGADRIYEHPGEFLVISSRAKRRLQIGLFHSK